MRTISADRPASTPRPWWALDPAGAVLGFIGALLSVTPSLLPRPALLQGAIAALSFAIGYLIGVVIWRLLRRALPARLAHPPAGRGWWLLYAGIWVLTISIVSGAAHTWQNEVRRLVAMPPLTGIDLSGFLVAFILLTVLLLLAGKGAIGMYRRFARRVRPILAGAISAVIVLAVLVGVVAAAMSAIDAIYLERNGAPDAEVSEPVSEFRSAGPQSAVDWDSLGRHGGDFVGGGPTADEISALTEQPALTPIRVYAGLHSAPTVEERAALVVSELERTGAFDREVLVVATTTGSGWLEPQSVDAIEYLYGGDTAIATMQYAYTPSWVSFVFDPDAPVDAARVLFSAVEAKWRTLPAADRPRLISYGLSLGAHGSQAVFSDLDDLRARVDGALFVGSPNGSELWRTLTASRDAGSPVWQPVVDHGREVRWISQPGDDAELRGTWSTPRTLYLQHPTDPVTWLGPELLVQSPEWLAPEQRSRELSPWMRWIPAVTALQVTVDMLGGEAVPASYGHNYGDVVVTGWTQIAGPTGLDADAIARIQAEIETYAAIPSYDE